MQIPEQVCWWGGSFENGVVPWGWGQIDKALMNLVTNCLQINCKRDKII